MSSLIVEVCSIDKIDPHKNADRMEVATIKGWRVCIAKDSFNVGDRVVYFPPDTVLTKTVSDKLGVTKYLAAVPDEPNSEEPKARVRVASLRGEPSCGFVAVPDQDWPVGTNVADYYQASKYEPVNACEEFDMMPNSPEFYKFYDMENIKNFPTLFEVGEEVAITEKIHGKSARLGLIREADEHGNAVWHYAAGSHDVRRKEFYTQKKRFDGYDLAEKQLLPSPEVEEGQLFSIGQNNWKVESVIGEKVNEESGEKRFLFKAELVDENGKPLEKMSEFWKFFTPEAKKLLAVLSECGYEDPEGMPVKGGNPVIIFGEMYGSGVQTGYSYGHTADKTFRAFDIAINRKYMGVNEKIDVLEKFGVPMVPLLYKGEFFMEKVEELTSGPSTISEGNTEDYSVTIGREGVVVTSVEEGVANTPSKFHDRRQLKSISFEYLKDYKGSEWH